MDRARQPQSSTGHGFVQAASPPRSLPPQALLERVYGMLAGTFSVLALDDDEDMLAMLVSYLQICPIFSVTGAATVDEALGLIVSRQWHCWVVDLYVPTAAQGLGLVAQVARHIPVVVLSGQSTGGEGYLCGQHGAEAFIDKGVIEADTLNARVFDLCLKKRLAPAFPFADTRDPRAEVLTHLFDSEVLAVAQWARALAVSRRALEQRVHEACGLAPLTVLWLYRLYRIAQRYCRNGGRLPFPLSRSERALLTRFVANPLLLQRRSGL